ncbi:MAG: hypothetical protein J0H99_12275, partial [Rhodospirillales bacterium]|nr:hypothetical protein [Rhodospirillales bacterium]
MVSRSFQGSTRDWYDAGSWSPSGVPQAGDVLSIASGTATISAADALANGPLDAMQLALGGDATPAAALDVTDGSFGSGFVLATTGSGSLTLAGSVTFAGTLLATAPDAALSVTIVPDAADADSLLLSGSVLVDNGDTITINGGTLLDEAVMTVQSGLLTLGSDTVLQGSGTIVVGAGAVVRLDGTVSPGVTIAFDGSGGTLQIGDPLAFQGSVVNFAKGDSIDLLQTPSDKWSYSSSAARLTIYAGNDSSSNPLAARFGLTSIAPLSTRQIFVGDDGAGG